MDPGEHDAVGITRTPRIRERNRTDLLHLVSLSSLIKLCALKFRRLQRAIARESQPVLYERYPCNSIERSKPVVTYTKRDFGTLLLPISFCIFFSFIFIFRSSAFWVMP